jgi:hypothetical protein
MVRHSKKHWAFLCLGKQFSLHLQNDRLPLNGRTGFLLFDGAVGALPREGLVFSNGPLCFVGQEASWHQQNSAWNLGFTCVCGWQQAAGIDSKLSVPMGQQSWQA